MTVSVIDPVNRAMGRTGQVLFKPFDIGLWFVLGFCAFLAYLGEGGGGMPSGNWGGGGRGGGGGAPTMQGVLDWIKANITTILVFATLILVFVVGLTALILWIRSRGKFMFLDGVVRSRGAVVEPWKTYRSLGNSLFSVSLGLWLLGFAGGLACFVIGLAIAWPDLAAGRFDAAAVTGVVVAGLLLMATVLVMSIVGVLLEDFVVPTMYLRDLPAFAAWSTVRSEVLAGREGTVVLYFLMKIGLGIVVGMIAVTATCLTCCIAAIPYLGSVILLPLLVFQRCYPLCFLEQFGPEWQFFGRPSRCSRCNYDLRGIETGTCPECGMSFGVEGLVSG
jgi:hypothetical protein